MCDFECRTISSAIAYDETRKQGARRTSAEGQTSYTFTINLSNKPSQAHCELVQCSLFNCLSLRSYHSMLQSVT
jgi:hypothetical protein